MLTVEIMNAMWPHGDDHVPNLRVGIVAASQTAFKNYGLTSIISVAQAMAQFSHECGEGLEMVENVNYSPARAYMIWPSHFSSPDTVYSTVGSWADDPQFHVKLMDYVYCSARKPEDRMGNHVGTHDGSTFIGRGLSQCTGRDGYQRLADKTGIDVISSPELLSNPIYALDLGLADFVLCGCLPFALADDTVGVTKHLNGGMIGLSERLVWLQRWKAVLIQDSLNRLGVVPKIVVDGVAGGATRAAISDFKDKNNLLVGDVINIELCSTIDKLLAT